MPYSINKYDGTPLSTVADGTIDQSTSLKLIGKNYAGYGEIQNENFLYLLENFASLSPGPSKPIQGQIWYDSGNKKLKFYDGIRFKTTGGAEITETSEPVGGVEGDFWYKSSTKQLYVKNAAGTYTLIGPQGVAGLGTTELRSRVVLDTLDVQHAIIEGLAGDSTVFIISEDTFTLKGTGENSITGFNGEPIVRGLTLAYTNTTEIDSVDYGVSAGYRFHGTASTADALVVDGVPVAALDFAKLNIPQSFTELQNFYDDGITVGSDARLRISTPDGLTPVIENFQSDEIIFKTYDSTVKVPIKLKGGDLLPGGPTSGVSNNIGSSGAKFNTIYATTFSGTATNANYLQVGSDYRTGAVGSVANTVAVRTGTGSLQATLFDGTATSARYADLAEKYLADTEYEVGTVLMIGGDKEVTACEVGFRAVGPVSEHPAHLMNSELEGGTAVALKGRVPVKVTGSVLKGQRLVAGPNGTAQVAMGNTADVFAIALESNSDVTVKLVEAIIL
jgi:hypothetical protein